MTGPQSVRSRHVQSAGSLICEDCLRWWPCDTGVLLAALDRAEHDLETAHEDRDYIEERLTRAEAANSTLRAALRAYEDADKVADG